jgi:pimeloyl-ACP methyl ester carboxylesterase
LFRQLAAGSPDNTVRMPYEVWQSAFIQDAPEPVQRLVYDLLVPQPMAYFEQAIDAPALSSLGLPVSYLAGSEDLAMPPGEYGWSPRFPRRLGVSPVEVPGGHESLLTRPDDFAAALLSTCA